MKLIAILILAFLLAAPLAYAQQAAPSGTVTAKKYGCNCGCGYKSDKPGKCANCGMTLEEKK